jgi:methionine sulfoxide reductase heme-binding subunit
MHFLWQPPGLPDSALLISLTTMTAKSRQRLARTLAHVLWALPFLWIVSLWGRWALTGDSGALGVNPIEWSIRYLGDWALKTLLATLVIAPLVRRTGWTVLMSVRRLTGLWAFSYVILHLGLYFGLDLALSVSALADDIAKRLYITAGMAALVLLIPLAVTSTHGWIKRLGARGWQRLHRLIYPAAILAVLHYNFMVRGNQLEPKLYAALLAALLTERLLYIWGSNRKANNLANSART